MSEGHRHGRSLGDYARDFFTNLDQPDMSFGDKWSKFVRNRFKATVLMEGCCGNHGEPGC